MEGLTVVATTRTADAKHPPSYSPGGAKVHPFFAFTRICPLSTGISICSVSFCKTHGRDRVYLPFRCMQAC